MLTVIDDAAQVDISLRQGQLVCPLCAGVLRPWGSARRRVIRHGVGADPALVAHRPRRGRCVDCLVTHVLLEVVLAARRADSAAVIAAAIEAKVARGWGHRKIGAWLGRPASTVRGWLRAFAACAEAITIGFTALVVRDAPDAAVIWPKPVSAGPPAALSALMAYAQGLGARFGAVVEVTWVVAGIAWSNGYLFSAPFWVRRSQHQLALTPKRGGGDGGMSVSPALVGGVLVPC